MSHKDKCEFRIYPGLKGNLRKAYLLCHPKNTTNHLIKTSRQYLDCLSKKNPENIQEINRLYLQDKDIQ